MLRCPWLRELRLGIPAGLAAVPDFLLVPLLIQLCRRVRLVSGTRSAFEEFGCSPGGFPRLIGA